MSKDCCKLFDRRISGNFRIRFKLNFCKQISDEVYRKCVHFWKNENQAGEIADLESQF